MNTAPDAELAEEPSFRSRLANDPTQTGCSATETFSGPLSIRNTVGAPPATEHTDSSSAHEALGSERAIHPMRQLTPGMCSSIIDAIVIALPSGVESHWKSIALNAFEASAATGGSENALLQRNVLDRQRCSTRAELRLAIVPWIERTYHRRHRQSALGKLTPIEFELLHQSAQPVA
jgi:putative transposase